MGRPARNLIGQRFGMLEVIKRDGTMPDGEAIWICKCDCGNIKSIRGVSLTKKNGTKSCGCLNGNPIDLAGQRYGALSVIRRVENQGNKRMWLCKCDCGNEVIVSLGNLRSGHSTQCKKCRDRKNSIHRTTHGHTGTSLYCVWSGMIDRCNNTKSKAYSDYGGRGISVCDEWNDSENFINWSLENGYKEGLEIDRIDVNGNYEPSNCRWVTRLVNANNKRNNVYIEHNGETKTIAEWARYYNVNYKHLWNNLSKGDTLEEAIRRIQMGDRSHRK